MVSLEKAKQQLQEAKEKIALTEKEIKERREEAQKKKKELLQVKEKLPKPTQRRLREGIFSGLMGRLRRKQVEKQKKSILERLGLVGSLQKELSKYEKEVLTPYKQEVAEFESQVKKVEQERARIERYNRAVKMINELIIEGRWGIITTISFWGDDLERKLAREALEAKKQLEEQQIRETIKGIETQLNTELPSKIKEELFWQLKTTGKADLSTITKRDLGLTEIKELPSEKLAGIKKSVKDYAVIGPAPSFGERFKSRVKQMGFVPALIATPGMELGDIIFNWEVQRSLKEPSYRLYQPHATRRAISTLPVLGAYFSPLGPAILTAEGAEKLITPSGRARIQQQTLSLQQRGLSPLVANIVSWGEPVVEVSLGVAGLRGQLKNLQRVRELKKLQQTPSLTMGYRFEQGPKGVDVLRSVKDVGSARYVSEIRQPYYRVGQNKFVLESGKGVSARIGKKGDILISGFESSGRGVVLETTPKLVGESRSVRAVWQLEGLQPSVSRVGIKEILTGSGKIKHGAKFPSGRTFQSGKIKAEYVKQPQTEWSTFWSISEGKGTLVKGISGKAEKLKLNLLTGEMSIKGKPEEVSFIFKKKIPESSTTEFLSIQGGGKKSSQKFFQRLYQPRGYEQALVQKSFYKVAPKPSEVPKTGTTSILNIKPEVSQISAQPSLFAGTGLYERTEDYGTGVQPTTILNLGQPTLIRLQERSLFRTFQPIRIGERVKSTLFPRIKEISKIKQEGIQKQEGVAKVKETSRSLQRLLQLQRPALVRKESTAISEKVIKPKKPLFSLLKPKKSKEKRSTIKPPLKLFKVKGRRYGREIEIGEFETQWKAEKALKKFLTQTLGRSGQIFRGSEALKFWELESFGTTQFRPSKKEPTRIVQKARFSLGTLRERKEIQKARKKKTKKIDWLS